MKFSVIVPIYNVERYLPTCIDSILCQSFQDFEIILVDDGSPDNCPELCDVYAAVYPNVHVIHKENGGLSSARNVGIANARGENVILIDSDDFWAHNSVLSDLARIIDQQNVDVVLFRAKSWNEKLDQNRIKLSAYRYDILNRFEKNFSLHYLFSEAQVPTGAYTLSVKRELLLEKQITFIEGIKSEDYDWIISILRECARIYASDEIHYVYRLGREGSITNTVDLKHIQDLMVTVNKWREAEGFSDPIVRADVRNYVAYIFSTALILSARLGKADRKKAEQAIRPFCYVMKFGYWKKLRIIRLCLKLFGIHATATVLNRLYMLKIKHELR